LRGKSPLAIVAVLLLANPPAASAGELGRHYETFHAWGNKDSPWAFKSWVKLEHGGRRAGAVAERGAERGADDLNRDLHRELLTA
jgi:hypothetical protein